MDVLDFNSLINQPLDKILKEQKQIFLLGDLNINLLSYTVMSTKFKFKSLKFYHSIYSAANKDY